MKKGIERLREQLNADPEAKRKMEENFRKMRPVILACIAKHEKTFPPLDPDGAKRRVKSENGSKLPDYTIEDAVCTLLDDRARSRKGELSPETVTDIADAFWNYDAEYFAMLARAAKYLKKIPHTKFSRHVVTCRLVAAEMMARSGKLPTIDAVKKRVIEHIGTDAYGLEQSSRWSPVVKAAGLVDLKVESVRKNRGDRYTAPDR